jgi:hypothetical protein
MDLPTISFIVIGVGLLLVPLDYITPLLFQDVHTMPNYYSLIVPVTGAILLGIGLLAYHKNNLRSIFLRACQDVEQTGFGRGIGNALAEAMRPLMGETNDGTLIPISSSAQ